ncbi:MAG: metal-sulfur cluster assembly factor [Patescibacteria group bacterium]|jgi:metal-sulfur cluster biosynthetic enzyme
MPVTEKSVRERLRNIRDPEIGLDIVTLGLFYGMTIMKTKIVIQMMLTTPGCPLTGYFTREIQRALLVEEGIDDVVVDYILDPPWTPERIDKTARLIVGM